MKRIRLVMVDDHPVVLEGMAHIFIDHPHVEVVGKATDAITALALVKATAPDVVITDINLPEINGIELCERLLSEYPGVRVIGMSTFSDRAFVSEMLAAGASGYITKGASAGDIEQAIEAAMRNQVTVRVDQAGALTPAMKAPVITRREKEVLLLIAEGLTNKEIGDRLFVSTSTIDSHRKNLLAKFNALNTAALVAAAARSGVL